jgi:hypothetical protein
MQRKPRKLPTTPEPLERLYTPVEAGEILRLAENTLAKMRVYGRGPEFTKAGRMIRYRGSALQRYIDANTRTSTP